MKKRFIILGAGKNKAVDVNPSVLEITDKKSFINWQLKTAKKLGCVRLDYVGGYQVEFLEEVLSKKVHVTYNPLWSITGPLYSLLLLDFNGDEDLYITYNDVIIDDDFLATINLIECSCLIDKSFPKRYRNKLSNCELIRVDGQQCEFVGFLYIPNSEVIFLKELQNNSYDYKKDYLSDLIVYLKKSSKKLNYIDCQLHWCDINFPEDIARFILRGKAKSLENLKKITTKSRYLKQMSFSTLAWVSNSEKIYQDISRYFSEKLVVVRSCAAMEDGFLESTAGAFESKLGVDITKYEAFSFAVSEVIESYDRAVNGRDFILVQPFIDNGIMHGVVFTRTHDGGPYYVFNYSHGNDTESITKGNLENHQTFYFFKYASKDNLPRYLNIVLESVQEIEQVAKLDSLDIEFILTKSKECIILQVRPQVSRNRTYAVAKEKLIEVNTLIKKQIMEKEPKGFDIFKNISSIWSVMSDWNPAEIIGRKPSFLALSLYEELVTNKIWAQQRVNFGYKDLTNYPLMRNFYGMPYIDVKASIFSFIPGVIDNAIAIKMLHHALDYLAMNLHLHDKVEFDVMPTCYRFDFKDKYHHILGEFSQQEVQEIEDTYKKITKKAFFFESGRYLYCSLPYHVTGDLEYIFKVIDNCKKGVLSFAHEARRAFVATSLMQSLVAVNAITQEEVQVFYQSLNTTSQEFLEDAYKCKVGKMGVSEYIRKYGHLRPGTYDLMAPRYDSNLEVFIYPTIQQASSRDKKIFMLRDTKIIDKLLKNIDSTLTCDSFFDFARDSIVAREKVKFNFTRDLSCILENISEYGNKFGLNRADMLFCDIPLLSMLRKSVYYKRDSTILKAYLDENKKMHEIRNKIELPAIISNTKDVDAFSYPSSMPNFISSQKTIAEKIYLERNFQASLKCKIVMIENADPGFDWIFSENIAGLVTMYGGVNSHMAVRAAECNIPAVIGVGEKKFNELLYGGRMLLLDCQGRKIIVLE